MYSIPPMYFMQTNKQAQEDERARIHLKKISSISDIIPHPPLGSNPDLVLINRRFLLGLLHPLVPIHLSPLKSKKQEIISTTKTHESTNTSQTLAERNSIDFKKESSNQQKLQISAFSKGKKNRIISKIESCR